MSETIDVGVPPSGTGCVECEAAGGWWFHLRQLTDPQAHPADQPTPGPAGQVPADWQRHLR